MKSSVERRSEILSLLKKTGSQKVESLARRFQVSSVTIRNDLNQLEQNGYIVRSYGYAVLRSHLTMELTHHDKGTRCLALKQKIAKKAREWVQENDHIILDSGTTTRELISHIQELPLTVLTNGLDSVMALSNCPHIEVRMTGGVLRKGAMSFSGVIADTCVRYQRFDKLFLGVDGFDLEKGITTFNEQEAQLNRLMCAAANKVIVLADSSKFGQYSNFVICEANQIDVLITDENIPDNYRITLETQGIEVVIAK